MSPAACAKCLCLFPTATSPVKQWWSSRKVSAPPLRALLAWAPWEAQGRLCVCCHYYSPAFSFAAQAVRDLGGRMQLMFAPASKDQRRWDISRECQGAAAFLAQRILGPCLFWCWKLPMLPWDWKRALEENTRQSKYFLHGPVCTCGCVIRAWSQPPRAVTVVLSSFSWLPPLHSAQHIHLFHLLCVGSHRQGEKIRIGLSQEDDFSFLSTASLGSTRR